MAKSAARVYKSRAYKDARASLIASGQSCHEPGCERPAVIPDHQPPLSRHRHVDGTGCCVLLGHCEEHSRAQGGELSREAAALARGGPAPDVGRLPASTWSEPPDPIVEPEGFPAGDAVWRVPWLKGLQRPPANAAFPRLATPPHPNATGSYGVQFAAFAKARMGRPLRWWQRHAAARILEHDAHGELVWEEVLLSTARQVGKSWLLRELLTWRLHQHDLFGGPQIVLHTSKDRFGAADLQAEVRAWARDQEGYRVTAAHGYEQISVEATGSQWIVLAKGAVFGRSAALAVVDEAWDAAVVQVEDGVIPTLIEPDSSQLLLVSTSNRGATALVPARRRAAIELLDRPGEGDLFLEWSGAPDADIYSERTWRQASPHWLPKRARKIQAAAQRALSGDAADPGEDPEMSLRTQYVNQWIPQQRTVVLRGDPLLPDGLWQSLASDEVTIGKRYSVAVEDHFGTGAAVAVAANLDGGRWQLFGWEYQSRGEAIDQINALIGRFGPGARVELTAGATLMDDPAIVALPVAKKIAGTATTARAAVAFLRECAGAGTVCWDPSEGGEDLTVAVERERVLERQSGILLAGECRHDLVKCAAWALHAQSRRLPAPVIY